MLLSQGLGISMDVRAMALHGLVLISNPWNDTAGGIVHVVDSHRDMQRIKHQLQANAVRQRGPTFFAQNALQGTEVLTRF